MKNIRHHITDFLREEGTPDDVLAILAEAMYQVSVEMKRMGDHTSSNLYRIMAEDIEMHARLVAQRLGQLVEMRTHANPGRTRAAAPREKQVLIAVRDSTAARRSLPAEVRDMPDTIHPVPASRVDAALASARARGMEAGVLDETTDTIRWNPRRQA